MKKKKNKAIVTLKDFSFHVIYEHCGGLGNHTKQRMVKSARSNITGCKTCNDGRFKQTEWTPLKFSEGMASVKYIGELTYKGLEQLIYNSCVSEVCNTAGMISDKGWMPAISLSSELVHDYSTCYSNKDEIRKAYGKNCCIDEIHAFQGLSRDEIYVSCCFSQGRFDEVVEQVLRGYSGNEKDFVVNGIRDNVCRIMDDLVQHVRHLVDESNESALVPKNIMYDARQLEFNFDK